MRFSVCTGGSRDGGRRVLVAPELLDQSGYLFLHLREAVDTMSTEAAETTSTRYWPPTLQPAAGFETVPETEGV